MEKVEADHEWCEPIRRALNADFEHVFMPSDTSGSSLGQIIWPKELPGILEIQENKALVKTDPELFQTNERPSQVGSKTAFLGQDACAGVQVKNPQLVSSDFQ